MADYTAKADVTIEWAEAHWLPPGWGYHLYCQPGAAISLATATKLTASPVPAWPAEHRPHRSADGLGDDGAGRDGLRPGGLPDGYYAASDGWGPDGVLTVARRYEATGLDAVQTTFAVVPVDPAGNAIDAATITWTLTPDGDIGTVASAFAPSGYAAATDTLTFALTY